MKSFEAGRLMGALNGLATIGQCIEDHLEGLDFKLGREEHGFWQNFVQDSIAELTRLKFKLPLASARSLKVEFERIKDSGKTSDGVEYVSWDWKRIKTIGHFAKETRTRTVDELKLTRCFIFSDHSADLYEPSEPLFGKAVDDAFPSSASDISEAGKCMALERWTASVMHIMRALEPGLLALQSTVNVNVPKEQWQGVIDQIENKIKEINKSNSATGDEKWFSEAATQFKWIKNAWRNYAMHLHEKYDEERATEIFNSTRALMRHLATRLSE